MAVTRKLYHSGIGYAVPRNTLAKANELRDWHIYAELGQNAVYTKIWIAVCAFLLLAIAKKRIHIEEPSLYMIS